MLSSAKKDGDVSQPSSSHLIVTDGGPRTESRLEGPIMMTDAVGFSQSVKIEWSHVLGVTDTDKTVTQQVPKYIGDKLLKFCDDTLAEIVVNIVENERNGGPEPKLCAKLKDHPFDQSYLVLFARGHERLVDQMLLLVKEKMTENEVLNHEERLVDIVLTEVTSEDGNTEEYNDREKDEIIRTGDGCDDEYEFGAGDGCDDENEFKLSPAPKSNIQVLHLCINHGTHRGTRNVTDETCKEVYTIQGKRNANVKKQVTTQLEKTHAESQKTCDDHSNEPAQQGDGQDAPIHGTERLKKGRTMPSSGSNNTSKEIKDHQAGAKTYARQYASGTNARVLPGKRKATTRMRPNSPRLKKQCTVGLISKTNQTTESTKYKADKNGNNAETNTCTTGHRNKSLKKSASKQRKLSEILSVIEANNNKMAQNYLL